MNGPNDLGTSRPEMAGIASVALSAVGPLAQAESRRSLSSRRKWFFRLISVSFPFAFLCLLELALNWMGIGKDLRLLVPAETSTARGMVRFNPDSDLAYYGPINLVGPEPRPFVLPKTAGAFRIVVIGASTVQGFPYPPELAFPRLSRSRCSGRESSVISKCSMPVLPQSRACARRTSCNRLLRAPRFDRGLHRAQRVCRAGWRGLQISHSLPWLGACVLFGTEDSVAPGCKSRPRVSKTRQRHPF